MAGDDCTSPSSVATQVCGTYAGGNDVAASNRNEIVAALRKEEHPVSAAIEETHEKAKALERELKGVRSALAALTDHSNSPAQRKAKRSPKSDVPKPPTRQRNSKAPRHPSEPNRSSNI